MENSKPLKSGLGPDGKKRCDWCLSSEDYRLYHDKEWGVPIFDDQKLFEKISLEGFQAGLSWITILRKRDNFRELFNHFDFNSIKKFREKDIERLLSDPGIIRHRGKIAAVINNSKLIQNIIDEFGSFSNYIWCFQPISNKSIPIFRAVSPESIALSKDLKERGWKFIGPTTLYAFMQSMGLVNDHAKDCFLRSL